jgi:hypothetical protein
LTDKTIMIPFLLKSFVILTVITIAFPVMFIPSFAATSTQNATVVTDTIPPETTITSAIDGNGTSLPLSGTTAAVTSSNSITISFNGTDNIGISGFQCSMDGQPAAACGTEGSNSSSVTFSNLAVGTHTFMVRAIDTSGIPDPTPATFTWSIMQTTPTPSPTPTPTPTPTPVDTTPPETTITSAIDGNGTSLPLSGTTAAVTSSNSITISFNGTDNIGISGFQCSMDGQPAAACTSPIMLNNLAVGTHTFMVRAIDTSGIPDPTPATFTWSIMQTTPTPSPTPTPTPTLCPINQLQLVMQLLRDIQGLNPHVAFAVAPALSTLQNLLSRSCGLANTNPAFTNPTPGTSGIFANNNQNNNNNNNIKAAECNLLSEFTNQVNIMTQYGQITPNQAAYLIGQSSSPHSAQQIAKQLGCLLPGSSISNNNNNNNDQTGRLMLFNRGIPSITGIPNANNPLPLNSQQQRQQQLFPQLPSQQIPQTPSQLPSQSSAATIPPSQLQQLQQQLQQQQAQLPFYPYVYGHYP